MHKESKVCFRFLILIYLNRSLNLFKVSLTYKDYSDGLFNLPKTLRRYHVPFYGIPFYCLQIIWQLQPIESMK